MVGTLSKPLDSSHLNTPLQGHCKIYNEKVFFKKIIPH